MFAKTSPKRSFAIIENERFGLVFAKTGSIKTSILHGYPLLSDKIQIYITETNSQESKLDGVTQGRQSDTQWLKKQFGIHNSSVRLNKADKTMLLSMICLFS